MRRGIIFSLFVIFSAISINSVAQTTGSDSVTNFTDINGNKQGQWIKYYTNGQVRYKGFFIDDVPQGTFYHYHPNGEVKAVQIFAEDGTSKANIKWDNGNLAAKGNYNKERKKTGKWIYFFREGGVESEVDYHNGKIDGKDISYFKTGKVLLEVEYEEGVKEGVYKFYFDNGQVREKGFYHNGVRHGEFVYFNPDGSLDEKGIYNNGERIGIWKIRNEEGEMKDIEYIAGEREDRDSLAKDFMNQFEWAEKNQNRFKQPEDYIHNPIQFFLDNR